MSKPFHSPVVPLVKTARAISQKTEEMQIYLRSHLADLFRTNDIAKRPASD